ncbi:MAG: hypothetical protein HZB83_02000, partial [Deltaproteobacteria bacterium]|nr:hypothetical protein [Deltaproteobacteria bacterium]
MAVNFKNEQIDEIKALLLRKDTWAVGKLTQQLHASDIGKILSGLEEAEAVEFFKVLEPESASEALLEVDERLRKKLMSSITPAELIEVVTEMETDDAADVISELPAPDAKQVLEGIDRQEAVEVK